jgi:hypothetical protein
VHASIPQRGTERPDALGADRSSAPAFARRAAHPGNVGSDVADERQIGGGQFPCDRHKQSGAMRRGDQRRQHASVDERAQPRPVLVGGVDQQTVSAGRSGNFGDDDRTDAVLRLIGIGSRVRRRRSARRSSGGSRSRERPP